MAGTTIVSHLPGTEIDSQLTITVHWEPERETLSRGIADWILERAGEIPEAREATEGPKDPSRAKL